MKKTLMYGLCCILCIAAFIACQKEISFEAQQIAAAKGSLQADNTGDCLPKIAKGTFIAGRALGDTNFIEIEVNVSTIGSYTIVTNTVNGYSFKGTGNFANTGINRIKLTGTGTPQAGGADIFTIIYEGTTCKVQVNVLPAGGGGPAVFTLDGAPDSCDEHEVFGTYTKGVALTGANEVEIDIDVTTIGTYTISTNTVNGFSFSGSGTLITTGEQTISLAGSGTPTAGDTTVFTVTAGTSNCTFKVVVTATPPPGCSATVEGTYTAGTALTSTNKATVQHTYASPGTYIVTTNVLNGYSFRDTITVTSTGVPVTITLDGTGTPAAAGNNTFTVNFADGTAAACTFTVTVNTGTSPSCSAAVQGTYTAGTALTSANKVTVQHTYAASGTYVVTTNVLNGYSFSKTVTVTSAGAPVTIILDGTGTPVAAGNNTFTVDFADGTTASCAFSVTVNPGTVITAGVYFPLTWNSIWSYGEPGSTDTVRRQITDSVIIGGSLYKVFVEKYMDGDSSLFFYKRTGNDYNEYNYVDAYTSFTFNEDIIGDILFLKEGLTTGATWNSATWTGTDMDDGSTKRLRYEFTCTDANATVTVGSNTFTNVYKISFKGQLGPGTSGGTWSDEGVVWEFWYAKNIGMIAAKGVLAGFPDYRADIRYWQVQ